MNPSRRDFGQRGQHEAAILKARMRQDQLGRRVFRLALGRQSPPMVMGPLIGQHEVAIGDEVQIDPPRLPARALAPPAKIRLNGMKCRKE